MKFTITGDAYVATTSLKVEDIGLVKKYRPEALKVVDEDGNEKFALGYREGHPGVGGQFITFGGKSRNEDGTATLTGTIPAGTEKVKDYVAEQFGPVMSYVSQLEQSIPAVVAEIKAQRDELLGNITIAG